MVEVRALCSPPEILHTKLFKPCPYQVIFIHMGMVMLKQGPPPNWCHKTGKVQLPKPL